MPQKNKTFIDNEVRNQVITMLDLADNPFFTRVNNTSFKTIVTDSEGIDRLVEVKIVVGRAETERTAADRLAAELAAREATQERIAARKEASAKKAAADKAKRLKKKQMAEEKNEEEGE